MNLIRILCTGLFLLGNFLYFGAHADSVICQTGQDSFARTLYPLLSQRCIKCHGDQGEETPHSVSDVLKAYKTSLTLVDFLNIDNSRFVTKVKQQHWLNDDPTQVGMTVDEITTALTAWWTGGENSCPGPFQFVSTGMPLPVPLATRESGVFSEIDWDLTGAVPALLGCKFKIQIQRFTTGAGTVPGSFRVKSPTIQCPGVVTLNRIRILVNGTTQAYENIFETVLGALIPTNTSTVLSSEEMILIERPGDNLLSVAFGSIQ